MMPLLSLVAVCALYVALLAGYRLLRRKRVEVQPVVPAPVQQAAPAPNPPAAVRFALPGMPPKRMPVAPPSWAAVERKLDAPRAARGSVPPPRLSPNRFDDVATTGVPIVRARDDQQWRDDEATGSSGN